MDAAGQDGFKWFGEGFDGFPKHLSESTLRYSIHGLTVRQSEQEISGQLQHVLLTARELENEHLKDYIWQKDGFSLEICSDKNTGPFLAGQTEYGDAVGDEWVIVYLLREISRRHKELWIRVADSDGEFLLIEAANVLPTWLTPEVAENRVWINDGRLLVIPLPKGTAGEEAELATEPSPLALDDALKTISFEEASLIHSPLLEEEAFYRIQEHPAAIQSNIHHAVIQVPRNLAYVLHQDPQVISRAVDAFYLRDPVSLVPLLTQDADKISKLNFPPQDLVTVGVTFPKVGYAQLKSQDFTPPAWEAICAESRGKDELALLETGMKVACGSEMFLADPQNQKSKTASNVRKLLQDIARGDTALPSNPEISAWGLRNDSEEWLNINFEDLERELAGNPQPDGGSKGFGDQAAHANLRKMVARFEKFMNDDRAGGEGADLLDPMDEDDDDSDLSDGNSEGEDKDLSFDAAEFSKMMREMMGIPSEAEQKAEEVLQAAQAAQESTRVEELADSDYEEVSSDDGEQLQDIMRRMEAELKESGALDLDGTESYGKIEKKLKDKEHVRSDPKASEDADDDDSESASGEVEIDYNLAKNMLESLKGQAGAAGPGGNLLGLMGMQMPRDEGDHDRNE